MRVVVDTNVIAAYVLYAAGVAEEAGELLQTAHEVMAPNHWHAELASAIWRTIVHGGVFDLAEGLKRLELARHLPIRSCVVPPLWGGALAQAVEHKHSPYDTLYIQLALSEGVPFATFDKKLLKLFPGVAHKPSALLST